MTTLTCPKCGFTFNPKLSLPSTICGKCGLIIPHDSVELDKLKKLVSRRGPS